MNSDLYIATGIVDLYVAGVLSPQEAEEVRDMAMNHLQVREEIKRIGNTHAQYAEIYADDLPLDFFNRLQTKIDELPEAEVVPPVKSKGNAAKAEKIQQVKIEKPATQAVKTERKGSSAGLYTVLTLSLLLLVASGLLNFYLYNELQSAQVNMVTSQSKFNILTEENNRLKIQNEEAFFKLAPYNSPDVKRIILDGLALSPQAKALVFWNPINYEVYLQVENLPEAPEGKVYQLWYNNTDNQAKNIGVILATKNSNIRPMPNAVSAKDFFITLEPGIGSEKPTLENILAKGAI